jgi:thioredoxin 2
MARSRHTVCPACGTTNRLPPDKAPRTGRCGACRELLFQGRAASVDTAGLERHRRNDDIPLLVDVWAPWCGPCRAMAPNFERAADMLEPEVRLLKLNADEAPEVTASFGVSGIPALLLFRGERLLARTAGAMDATRIVAWTRGQLAGQSG